MAEVVILGAGLTGLSVAYHLEQLGFTDFEIYEQQEKPGGLLQSFTQDGFTFDHTGHLLHISDPYFKEFLNTIANLNNFDNVSRRSAIFSNSMLSDYPFQINLNGLPGNVVYDCLYGFLNRKKTIRSPKNFHEWVLKYFGAGLGKHFFFPYQEKILSYDIKKIHPSWTGRFVPKTSVKSILQGALLDNSIRNVGYNKSFYYPKRGGIEFIIQQLRKKIITPLKLNHKAINIDTNTNTVHFENGSKTSYKKLITTAPLDKLLTSLAPSSRSTLSKQSDKLLCASVLNFNLGFDKAKLFDKHWIYFPEKKVPFYRLGFWHNINKHSVKNDCSAIYGETSFLRGTKTKTQQKALINKSISSSLKFLGLRHNNIVTQKILPLKHAYVIYDTWREKNLTKIFKQLTEYSIISIGRFGGWKYNSMQEAVLDGRECAQQLIKQQKQLPSRKVIPAVTYVEPSKQKRKRPRTLQKRGYGK